MKVWEIVTPTSIKNETYYNLLQLCKITGYANPIKALEETREEIAVVKDSWGNIIRRT